MNELRLPKKHSCLYFLFFLVREGSWRCTGYFDSGGERTEVGLGGKEEKRKRGYFVCAIEGALALFAGGGEGNRRRERANNEEGSVLEERCICLCIPA